jgi:DNA-binding CsgD family transcriptional regulator
MGGHMADTKKRAATKKRIAQAEARARQAELRAQQAKARAEQAQTRIEQAETRAEQAKTRAEQAETRIEQAETRTEQAETHAEEIKTILHQVIQSPVIDLPPAVSRKLLKDSPADGATEQKKLLEQLTPRQREILQLIAEGQNTKQIGEKLRLSPKTVEYHRQKVMAALNLHDIPALVRFAVLVGLISPEA